MKSYQPEELFDRNGKLMPELAELGAERRRAGWAPTRTPMAACCCVICGCRISAIMR